MFLFLSLFLPGLVEDITLSKRKDNILDSSRDVPTSISRRPTGRNFLIARQELSDYLKEGPPLWRPTVPLTNNAIDQPVTSYGAFNAPWCRHDTRTLN